MYVGMYIGLVALIMATLISMFRVAIYQRKLYRYLLTNHTEKWKELTTIWGVGPGMINSRRGLKFLFGRDYLDDPEVLRMKIIVRNSVLYVISGFFAIFFWWCVIVVVTAPQ